MILLAVLGLAFAPAWAESAPTDALDQTGFDQIERLAGETGGLDVRSIAEDAMSGQLQPNRSTVRRLLRQLKADLRKGLLRMLRSLAVPMAAGLALRALLGEKTSGRTPAMLAMRLTCLCVLMGEFVDCRTTAEILLEKIVKVGETVTPVVIAASQLSGLASASALSMLPPICAELIERVLSGFGLPLCSAAAAVAAAGSMTAHFRFDALYELLKSASGKLALVLLGGFMALMSMEGLMGASQDTLAAKTAHAALESVVPVIGSEVSAAFGSVAASARLARNAVGITGMLLILNSGLQPLLKILVSALSAKLAAAMLEPLADPGMALAAKRLADAMEMLLVLCIAGTVLAMITLGGCLAMAGRTMAG